MFPDLTTRHREHEWMDDDDVDPRQLRRSLAFIRAVNRMFGYTRATLFHLEQFSKSWKPGETIKLIDFATGSADIARAILKWADKKGFDVHIVAVEQPAATVDEARAKSDDPRLHKTQGDVLNLPFDQ